MEKAKVYFTKKIDAASLIAIYKALGRNLHGKVAVKISTGEPGGHNFLQPSLIGDLTHLVTGTIVECCTVYEGKRMKVEDHWQTVKDHGFSAMAPCDIMDEMGETELPVKDGFHLKTNIVGDHFTSYDSMLILSHFKGHMMGGFGGALKNMSIGIASSRGKANIHTAGATADYTAMWDVPVEQDDFLESMADACKSVIDYMGKDNILYISVANNLSVDCDCDSNPHPPEMDDIGIFASIDPVALDQACYDAVINSPDPGKASLIERMDSRHGIHTVEAAAQLGLGVREYEIISID
ncbi:MAG: DUF362 domain-containing protein [Oscillospiraceae bacterium]|nr:DUF362 domain-containing protein [Oscillospiraceae bacterium]